MYTPTPIARAHFWQKVIDIHYHELTPNERVKLFEWLNRNRVFQEGLEKGNEDCVLFNARFNPDNQYKITTGFKGDVKENFAFLWKDEYYTSHNILINREFIVKEEKI